MRCYIDYNSLACLSTSELENAITRQDTKEDTDDVKMTPDTGIVREQVGEGGEGGDGGDGYGGDGEGPSRRSSRVKAGLS